MQVLSAIGGVFRGTSSGTQHSKGACRRECLDFFILWWRFRPRNRLWPQRPAEAQGAQPAPAGLPPDRAAQPDRGRSGPQVIAPANTVLSSSVQDGGAFSGAAIGRQCVAGLSRRGGGIGGGRRRGDRTLLTLEYGSDETSCADTFRIRCDSSA